MKKSLMLIIPGLLIRIMVFGQCTSFITYHTKGDVALLRSGVSTPLKKEMKIDPGTVLRVGTGGSVILLTGNDKALRLTQPVTLSYSDLSVACRKNQSSLTQEYMKYVAQAIIEKEESQTAMVVKGAVYRTRAEYSNCLMRIPADSSVITEESIRFAWQPPADDTPRYLLIYENGVKRIFSQKVSDTTLTLPISGFKPATIYFWLVTTSENPSDNEPRFTFVHGTPQWQNTILDQWAVTMKELEGEMDEVQKKLDAKKNLR